MVFEMEPRDLGMRAPDHAPDLHSSLHQAHEHVGELLTVDEFLVGIAAPVGEVHPVSGLHLPELRVQTGEVRPAVHQQFHMVPLGERRPVTSPSIQERVGVASILGRKEPVGGGRV